MKEIQKKLIQKAQNGDIRAFEEIYKLTSGFVYAVSYRVVNNYMDAQEITQDVFCKIYKKLEKLETDNFIAWMYRVTVNTAINCYNKNKRKRMREGDFEIAIQTKGVEPSIEKDINTEDSKKKIDVLLDKLNPDQRACIVLREIEGLTYEETAKALNVKINTVRTRLKRARGILMKYAKEKGSVR